METPEKSGVFPYPERGVVHPWCRSRLMANLVRRETEQRRRDRRPHDDRVDYVHGTDHRAADGDHQDEQESVAGHAIAEHECGADGGLEAVDSVDYLHDGLKHGRAARTTTSAEAADPPFSEGETMSLAPVDDRVRNRECANAVIAEPTIAGSAAIRRRARLPQ
ncbi:hypothetical protein [Microbacterium sp. USHLN272]|uniref:hypothetical protein n=1 Tax=Microbacterium sp. USHLN272 TaxID=3081287 RepID=UPI0030180FB6